jgi:hypothetical protein
VPEHNLLWTEECRTASDSLAATDALRDVLKVHE